MSVHHNNSYLFNPLQLATPVIPQFAAYSYWKSLWIGATAKHKQKVKKGRCLGEQPHSASLSKHQGDESQLIDI